MVNIWFFECYMMNIVFFFNNKVIIDIFEDKIIWNIKYGINIIYGVQYYLDIDI